MEVLSGFTVHGMDVGKWLARQRKPEVWAALAEGQRERLEAVGSPRSPPPRPRWSRTRPQNRPRRL